MSTSLLFTILLCLCQWRGCILLLETFAEFNLTLSICMPCIAAQIERLEKDHSFGKGFCATIEKREPTLYKTLLFKEKTPLLYPNNSTHADKSEPSSHESAKLVSHGICFYEVFLYVHKYFIQVSYLRSASPLHNCLIRSEVSYAYGYVLQVYAENPSVIRPNKPIVYDFHLAKTGMPEQ